LDALASALQQQAPDTRRTDPDNLHLTLAFIGEMSLPDAARLSRLLTTMASPTGTWLIDHVGWFAQAGVAWAAGPRHVLLDDVVRLVRGILDAEAIDYDRRPFVPHITLLRRCRSGTTLKLDTPIAWMVAGPVLMTSTRSASGRLQYRPWSSGSIDVPR